jgi:hypothetical protein
MPYILRIYHIIHWECSLVTNHQVSPKMWFFTLLVKSLGKIRSPLIIVWQQLMPYVPLKVEPHNAVEAGWCYTKGISTSTNSWILLQQMPYCFNINFGTRCFWLARICLVSVETCSVIVVFPDVFSAKLLCTVVMRLNSIQWPIDGWIDRSSKQSGGGGGGGELAIDFLSRFLELRDVQPTNRS